MTFLIVAAWNPTGPKPNTTQNSYQKVFLRDLHANTINKTQIKSCLNYDSTRYAHSLLLLFRNNTPGLLFCHFNCCITVKDRRMNLIQKATNEILIQSNKIKYFFEKILMFWRDTVSVQIWRFRANWCVLCNFAPDVRYKLLRGGRIRKFLEGTWNYTKIA